MDPTVYFTGTGTYLLFSLGVAKYLKEHYPWERATVLTVSGGGIPAVALLTLPITHFDILAAYIARTFTTLPTGLGRQLSMKIAYHDLLRAVVQPELLPQLRNRLLIKTTVLPFLKGKIYSGPYDTVDEVIGDLATSAYIPLLFFLCPPYKGHFWEVDGGLGISKWKHRSWSKTLVVGPRNTGCEDIWYHKGFLNEAHIFSYDGMMKLYQMGYQRAKEHKALIDRKLL